MSCDPRPKLNSTAAIARQGLPGPYQAPHSYSPGRDSPEYSMSKPGYRRETNAGDEKLSNVCAELKC